ncbi:MAG: hypothetical protein ACAF41_26270 [Leptolyngbya sp. BL-A-14]
MTQNDYQSQENTEALLSKKAIYSILVGLSLLALSAFLLFGVMSVDLDCSRSPSGLVECSYTRNTPLIKTAAYTVLEPLAADVIEVRNKANISYNVELRAANISYTLPLLSAYDYKIAQAAANEVNAFLHSSNEKHFAKRFPEKRVD